VWVRGWASRASGRRAERRRAEPVGTGNEAAPGRNVAAKRGLSRSLADQSFGELRRMLEYKGRWYGAELVICDRFFPSSRTCSGGAEWCASS
jgi:transposase